MALPLRPYHPQRFIHQKLHPNRTESSSIFNATPTRPFSPLTFSMVYPIPRPLSPTVAKLPPGTWPGKILWSFPLRQLLQLHSATPPGPLIIINNHYVRKQQLSLACRLAFAIYPQHVRYAPQDFFRVCLEFL